MEGCGRRKKYVDVDVHIDGESGAYTPRVIYWSDAQGVPHRFPIDRIVDRRKAASLKAGGAGMRYACVIRGKPPTYLFHEGDGRWFVEEKVGTY